MGFRSHYHLQTIKLQHIKGITSILADSVSGLKAVGLYHNLNYQHSQPEHGTPFEPLPLIEQATHTPITVDKNPTKPNLETLAKQFTVAQIENPNIPLGDKSPEDETQLEQKLMSLSKLTPEKITRLPKDDTSATTLSLNCITTHMKTISQMPWASYRKRSLTSTVHSHL